MATAIVDAATSEATTREAELEEALDAAICALHDIQGVLDLIHEEGSITAAGFPNSIAGAIRMVSHRVDSTMPVLQEARG